jgi:adenosylcobinamide-phosphate synthase
VAEAAFAAALDLRLGGDNIYSGRVETRVALGTGRAPQPGDIAAATRLAHDVSVVLAAVLAMVAMVTDRHASALRHRRNKTATRRSSPAS